MEETLEGTFAMIKPDAVDRAPHIFTRIVKEGFLVVEQQRFRFSRELAELFYEEHRKKPFFGDLVDYITSGPVVAMCLARQNGVQHWRRVLGPTKVSDARKKAPDSIRAVFGDSKNDSRNACHGSDSPASAEREIEIIFPHIFKGSENVSNRPESGQSAMINGHSYPIREQTAVFQEYDNEKDNLNPNSKAKEEMARSVNVQSMDNKAYLHKYVVPTLLKGLSEMYEVRPKSPVEWLADWLEENNPYKA